MLSLAMAFMRAYAAHLIAGATQRSQKQLLALRLRSRMSFLRQATPLHIFVVTLRCEHSCPYCLVSRQSSDRSRFDMSEQTAMLSLDIALQSQSKRIKIEFQGGERSRRLYCTILNVSRSAPVGPTKLISLVRNGPPGTAIVSCCAATGQVDALNQSTWRSKADRKGSDDDLVGPSQRP